MDVAARHRVADPEQHERTVFVRRNPLESSRDQRVDVQLPFVAGHGGDLVEELRGRRGAVLDHRLIDRARLFRFTVDERLES